MASWALAVKRTYRQLQWQDTLHLPVSLLQNLPHGLPSSQLCTGIMQQGMQSTDRDATVNTALRRI
jgi:hypothetical protein